MPLRLECVRGSLKGETRGYDIPRLLIGRSREAGLRLDAEQDVQASGRHCEILDDDGSIRVRDLGSTNGTFINGDRVTEERRLSEGDLLSLGREGPTFVVHIEEPSDALGRPERDTRTEAIPVSGSLRGPRSKLPLVLLLVVILAGAAVLLWSNWPKGGDDDSSGDDAPFVLPEADEEEQPDLEDPPETPLSELPPLEDWVLGRWRAALSDGAQVLGPATGDQALLIEISREAGEEDRFVATAIELGAARRDFEGRKGEAVYRLRFLRRPSERGGTAYFRASRFDAADLAAGGDGWISRNDRLYVDLRRGHIRGNLGVFIRESE